MLCFISLKKLLENKVYLQEGSNQYFCNFRWFLIYKLLMKILQQSVTMKSTIISVGQKLAPKRTETIPELGICKKEKEKRSSRVY